ncbi:MAG: Holliday junction branch migration protein RuvA [bacterium]
MISHLQGVLTEKSPTRIVVDVQGVGYEVMIPVSTYEELGDDGASIKLLTYLNVREDALQLFGFASAQERWMFSNLILVSGIGPKLALGILSGSSVEDLKRFIVNGDITALTRLPGVGKKTAQRVVTELREKLGGVIPESEYGPSLTAGTADRKYEDALSALISLGCGRASAQRSLDAILGQQPDIALEDLVKKALQKI